MAMRGTTVADVAAEVEPVLTQRLQPVRTGGIHGRASASGLDLSHDPPDDPLLDAVAAGTEPYLIVDAMAGG
jgi:hypothetical protein